MSQDQDNKELCKLININEDACIFYDSAQKKVEDPRLKATLGDLKSLHSNVKMNLQNQVRANGGNPDADETFVGQTQKFWGELMANISNDVDSTLVAHLEEAEDRCLHSIQDVIDNDDVSPLTKATLQSEYSALQKSHDYMKSLKDAMKAA